MWVKKSSNSPEGCCLAGFPETAWFGKGITKFEQHKSTIASRFSTLRNPSRARSRLGIGRHDDKTKRASGSAQ
nr:MAG TPA: hypothetical protein [Caudoviricetes sp.]